MLRYEKKLKRTFFLFLGAFSLTVCLITFFVIFSSLENKYIDFAQNHTNLLQQNISQKMDLFAQNVSFFANDTQLIINIQNGNSDFVNKKAQNFQQSSSAILKYAVFQVKNDSVTFLTGNRNTLSSEKFFSNCSEQFFSANWYFLSDEKNPFLYLYPIQSDYELIGYLVFRIDVNSFLSSFLETTDSCLWTEHIAIISDQILWCDDRAYWNAADPSVLTLTDDFLKTGKAIFSSNILTETGERFVQVLEKKSWELYRPLFLGLSLMFFFSLPIFWYMGSKNIHKIISRLQQLNAKMSQLKQ